MSRPVLVSPKPNRPSEASTDLFARGILQHLFDFFFAQAMLHNVLHVAVAPGSAHMPGGGPATFLSDAKLREALLNRTAQQALAAHLIPALCLALLNQNPEVRVAAAFRLMCLGDHARCAADALQDAARDPDDRVRRAAEVSLWCIQSEAKPAWQRLFAEEWRASR